MRFALGSVMRTRIYTDSNKSALISQRGNVCLRRCSTDVVILRPTGKLLAFQCRKSFYTNTVP